MTALVYQSKAHCLENRRLLAASRVRIVQSRRRLNRHWTLAGAADGPGASPFQQHRPQQSPYDLEYLVRDKIKRGALFVLANSTCVAGAATGKTCVVCDEPMFSGAEAEIHGPKGLVSAHLVCHGIWCQESRTARERRSTGPRVTEHGAG
jgi:hypothetical protein